MSRRWLKCGAGGTPAHARHEVAQESVVEFDGTRDSALTKPECKRYNLSPSSFFMKLSRFFENLGSLASVRFSHLSSSLIF